MHTFYLLTLQLQFPRGNNIAPFAHTLDSANQMKWTDWMVVGCTTAHTWGQIESFPVSISNYWRQTGLRFQSKYVYRTVEIHICRATHCHSLTWEMHWNPMQSAIIIIVKISASFVHYKMSGWSFSFCSQKLSSKSYLTYFPPLDSPKIFLVDNNWPILIDWLSVTPVSQKESLNFHDHTTTAITSFYCEFI